MAGGALFKELLLEEVVKSNVIKEKSFGFAISIIKIYKQIVTSNKEFVMSKQLLRAGTSIGANIREALNAESRADFIHKMGVAQKECDETLYWIELIRNSCNLEEADYKTIHNDAEELLRIIKSIILSAKQKRSGAP